MIGKWGYLVYSGQAWIVSNLQAIAMTEESKPAPSLASNIAWLKRTKQEQLPNLAYGPSRYCGLALLFGACSEI